MAVVKAATKKKKVTEQNATLWPETVTKSARSLGSGGEKPLELGLLFDYCAGSMDE